MKEIITSILEDSSTAPSPDNFQPWRFEVRNEEINVFKVPSLMNHLLDSREHVLILTVGMLIENIVIASTHYGYKATVSLFPPGAGPDQVAKITLAKEPGLKEDPLYGFLKLRCTNRKKYRKEKISQQVLDELRSGLAAFPGMEMQFITRQEEIKKIGKAVSAIDKVMCENQQLHQALFRHITWTIKEEQETHQGLSLDSMELKSHEKMLFKAIKNWPVINTLNKIGFSNVIRAQNAAQYSSAVCSVVISNRDESNTGYANAGRFAERFWLNATRNNLSLHPIVGVIYCSQKVKEDKTQSLFTAGQVELLNESYSVVNSIAGSHGKTNPQIMFYFRMGYAKPTAYKSTRKKAVISFV